MTFQFSFSYRGKLLTFDADIFYESNQIQRIKISTNGRSITIQGDYPLIKSTNAKRKIKWQIIEGDIKDWQTFQRIINEVEDYIKHPNGHPTYKDHWKNK